LPVAIQNQRWTFQNRTGHCSLLPFRAYLCLLHWCRVVPIHQREGSATPMKHTPTESSVPITSHIFHRSKSSRDQGAGTNRSRTNSLVPRHSTLDQRNPFESPSGRTDVQLSSPSGPERLALQKAAAMIKLTVLFDGSKFNELHQLGQNLAKIGVHAQSIRQLRQNMAPASSNSRAKEYGNRPEHFSGTTRHRG